MSNKVKTLVFLLADKCTAVDYIEIEVLPTFLSQNIKCRLLGAQLQYVNSCSIVNKRKYIIFSRYSLWIPSCTLHIDLLLGPQIVKANASEYQISEGTPCHRSSSFEFWILYGPWYGILIANVQYKAVLSFSCSMKKDTDLPGFSGTFKWRVFRLSWLITVTSKGNKTQQTTYFRLSQPRKIARIAFSD